MITILIVLVGINAVTTIIVIFLFTFESNRLNDRIMEIKGDFYYHDGRMDKLMEFLRIESYEDKGLRKVKRKGKKL